MSEHTPGPWQVLSEEDDRQYLRIRGTEPGQLWKIANVHHDPHAYYPWDADETRANASLIACAASTFSVPFCSAQAKRSVTPVIVRRSETGNPAMIASAVIPAK